MCQLSVAVDFSFVSVLETNICTGGFVSVYEHLITFSQISNIMRSFKLLPLLTINTKSMYSQRMKVVACKSLSAVNNVSLM